MNIDSSRILSAGLGLSEGDPCQYFLHSMSSLQDLEDTNSQISLHFYNILLAHQGNSLHIRNGQVFEHCVSKQRVVKYLVKRHFPRFSEIMGYVYFLNGGPIVRRGGRGKLHIKTRHSTTGSTIIDLAVVGGLQVHNHTTLWLHLAS